MKKKLVVLSGPSCVGKGPLRDALQRLRPDIDVAEPLLCHSRRPRLKQATGRYEVHGVDYYFLPRGQFAQLDPQRFIIVQMRSEIQALDLEQVRALLASRDLVLTEAYHTMGRALMEWARAQRQLDFDVRSVFLLPLSDDEIAERAKRRGLAPEQVVYEEMKFKLARRGEDAPDKIEERARSAWSEMQDARHYTDRIVNHAGEDDVAAWRDPLGAEAQRTLDEFVRVLTRD